MKMLTDENLLKCFIDAVKFQVEPEFIQMLLLEIKARDLKVPAIGSGFDIPATPEFTETR